MQIQVGDEGVQEAARAGKIPPVLAYRAEMWVTPAYAAAEGIEFDPERTRYGPPLNPLVQWDTRTQYNYCSGWFEATDLRDDDLPFESADTVGELQGKLMAYAKGQGLGRGAVSILASENVESEGDGTMYLRVPFSEAEKAALTAKPGQ